MHSFLVVECLQWPRFIETISTQCPRSMATASSYDDQLQYRTRFGPAHLDKYNPHISALQDVVGTRG